VLAAAAEAEAELALQACRARALPARDRPWISLPSAVM